MGIQNGYLLQLQRLFLSYLISKVAVPICQSPVSTPAPSIYPSCQLCTCITAHLFDRLNIKGTTVMYYVSQKLVISIPHLQLLCELHVFWVMNSFLSSRIPKPWYPSISKTCPKLLHSFFPGREKSTTYNVKTFVSSFATIHQTFLFRPRPLFFGGGDVGSKADSKLYTKCMFACWVTPLLPQDLWYSFSIQLYTSHHPFHVKNNS